MHFTITQMKKRKKKNYCIISARELRKKIKIKKKRKNIYMFFTSGYKKKLLKLTSKNTTTQHLFL